MKLRILHLSDLHVNESEELYLASVSRGLCEDVGKFKAQGFGPDLVCITGDLINKGENASTEFALADSLFLDPLSKTLQLEKDNFIIIPGNHEVDRKQTSASFEQGFSIKSQQELRKFCQEATTEHPDFAPVERKLRGFLQYKDKFPSMHRVGSSFFLDTYIVSKGEFRIGIAGVNSAWRSSQHGPDDRRLIVGEHFIMEAHQKLKDCDLKICLCHHPFEMLAEWDARAVRQKLALHFDVLLNGHIHDSDIVAAQFQLGSLFVSTAGSLRPDDPFASYSFIEIDLSDSRITCHFRKWISRREVFDCDTEKAPSGFLDIGSFRKSPSTSMALQANAVRGELKASVDDGDIVYPIDGLEEVHLREVFVEPMITDKSHLDRDGEARQTFEINRLVKSSGNLVFVGRPEYGKTTLLNHIQEYILANERSFDGQIPVFLRFSDIPKANAASVIKTIKKALACCSEREVQTFCEEGKLILLVDDLEDRQDRDREKRSKTLREFCGRYRKCKLIFTTTEHLTQPLKLELLTLAASFGAQLYFISSLNTSRIRQLLLNWKVYQTFEVEKMLDQILYYFQHFQIPVTPLAVTLFLGVLFRKKKEKNIRNEAYLIENYLETILEKLQPGDHDSDLDFKDKEAFLAHIAVEMAQRGSYQWHTNDFEQAKLAYFEALDEDVPHASLFDAFFRKGILTRDDGLIYFKRRFWFHFFLAKGLEKSSDFEDSLLARDDVLMFSKALGYKAGLSRNDLKLLRWVDGEVTREAAPMIQRCAGAELSKVGNDAPLEQITKAIEREIKEKNSAQAVDGRRDKIFLGYDEDHGSLSNDHVDRLEELITLQSDVIRNTTQVLLDEKRRFIANNVRCYIALMWSALEQLRDQVHKLNEEDLFRLFFKGRKDATTTQKLRYVLDLTQRIVQQVVPISILLYMAEHVGNPKLVRSFRSLAAASESPTEKLFYSILCFSQDPKQGIKDITALVSSKSSTTEDFIIYGYLRCFCYENELAGPVLDKVIDVMAEIRKKCAVRVPAKTPFAKDSFRTDMKRQFVGKHLN